MQSLQIVFGILLAAVTVMAFFTEKQHEVAKSLADACHAELGGALPEDFAKKMRQGDPSLDSEVAKCTIQCIFAKVGFTDDTGATNRTVLVAKLSKGNPTEKVERFADLCDKNDVGQTKCDKAFGLYKCYHKNKSIFD